MTITVTKAGTTLSYTGASLIATNRPATLSATLEEDGGSAPVPDGQTVTLTLGSGSGAQSCQGQTTSDGWVSCQIATVNQALGNQPVSATFAGDHYYAASSDTSQQGLVFSYLPAGGGFAVGDQAVHNATPTTTLTWWGSKWAKLNPPSGGGAPASFKGFAQTFLNGPTTVADPVCGGTWTGTTDPSAGVADQRAGLHGRSGAEQGHAIGQHDLGQHHQGRDRQDQPRLPARPRPSGHRDRGRHALWQLDAPQ